VVCPAKVPIVSQWLARRLVYALPADRLQAVLLRSLEWLTARHEGLHIYVGITGRAYTREEKAAIAHETAVVAELICPLRGTNGCLLGGLGAEYSPALEMYHKPFGFLPSLVAKYGDGRLYKDLAASGTIADAKIALLTRNQGLSSPIRKEAA